MSDCLYKTQCKNNTKCFRCQDENLLKLPKNAKVKRIASTKDSWEELEVEVANQLNKVPTISEARRAKASGALWYEKGDVLDYLLHCECKERQGNVLKGGNKSFSIQKLWLDKAKEETRFNHKAMCLPFRFKDEETIYGVMEFNDIAEIIQISKAFVQDNERLSKENELLKKECKRLMAENSHLKKQGDENENTNRK